MTAILWPLCAIAAFVVSTSTYLGWSLWHDCTKPLPRGRA